MPSSEFKEMWWEIEWLISKITNTMWSAELNENLKPHFSLLVTGLHLWMCWPFFKPSCHRMPILVYLAIINSLGEKIGLFHGIISKFTRDFDRTNIPWNIKSKSFHPKVKWYQETDIKIFKYISASHSSLHTTRLSSTWVVHINPRKGNHKKRKKP